MTYFMSFSSLAWIFPTTSGLLSQQRWLFPPDQLFKPGQSDRGKILPAWLCSSAHTPSVAPTVFRVKFNYPTSAFSSFQNPTPAHFQSDCLQIFFFSSQIPVAYFPSMLHQFLSPWLISTCISCCVNCQHRVFYQTHSGFTGFFSHTSLDCYWMFFCVLSIYPTQWQAIWDQWLHLPDLAFFLRAPSLLLYIE